MTTLTLSEKKRLLLVDYCQFLLASFQNFTQTYFADHIEKWSHDQLNRLLNTERITARDLWQSVKNDIEFDEDGYLLFDDMVVPKQYAKEIETVRRQWSGSEKQRHPRHRYCVVCLRQPEDGRLIGSLITVFMTMTAMVKPNFSTFRICCEMLTSSKGLRFGQCLWIRGMLQCA